MKKIKLVALDMDGTLLTSDETISAYTEKMIKQALAQNVYVVLSTGRTLTTSYPYAESLNLRSYIITCNGGEIWTTDKKLIEQNLMEAKQIEKMWFLAQQQEITTWLVSTEEIFYNKRPDDFYIHKWLKFGCYTPDKQKLRDMIQELSYFDDVELSNSLPDNLEVNPKGVHKASGLSRVCQAFDIKMDDVMAVGDSLNDMKMIQEARIGVAMGNAQEAVKKAADVITDTNDDGGVAEAIRRYVL